MEIRYYRESKYGNELRYPLDHADAIKMLTGRLTLSKFDIGALTALGFKLVEVLKP